MSQDDLQSVSAKLCRHSADLVVQSRTLRAKTERLLDERRRQQRRPDLSRNCRRGSVRPNARRGKEDRVGQVDTSSSHARQSVPLIHSVRQSGGEDIRKLSCVMRLFDARHASESVRECARVVPGGEDHRHASFLQ